MKKGLLLIILLALLKKKMCQFFCDENNFENRECGWFGHKICELNKKACNSKNCKDCLNCVDGTFCKTCKSGYEYNINKKTCFLEKQNNQGNQDNQDSQNSEDSYQPEDDGIICHPYCQNCSISPSSESMNCILCQEYLFKIYGSDNCYDESLLSKGYYLKDNIFYPCDENCLTCSGGKNETSNNCLSCDNVNKSLYLLEDIKNCEERDFPGYYLNIANKTLQKCHESCKTCNGPYEINIDTNIENHNCIECADNYYKLTNGSFKNNCYDNTTINLWKNIEKINLNINFNSSMNILDYFTNKIEATKDIKTIFNEIENNSNQININSNEIGTFSREMNISNNVETIYNEIKTITTTYNNIEINYNQSSTSPKIEETVYKEIKYKSTFYMIDSNTEISKTTFNNVSEKQYIKKISLEEFKSDLSNNIKTLLNSSEPFNGSDFMAIVLSSDNFEPKEQLKKGISAVDLGNCIKIIKDHYNISEDENLIIVNMESKNTKNKIDNNDNSLDIRKNTQIEIYDFSGNKLDLSVCKEDIKIIQYIKDIEELDIQSAINLANIGVDVFNASDDYFNDICHNYENNKGKDIIIKDRRNDIYQNVSFCQIGCKYYGIDYTYFAANCICNSSFLQSNIENNNNNNNKTNEENNNEEKLNFSDLKESILSNLFNFNINVIYCYNVVFNLKLLKHNIGFFTMIFLFFLQVIFFIIYLVKKLRPIKQYMLIFWKNYVKTIKAFPPLKSKVKKTSLKNSLNENNLNSQTKFKLETDNGKIINNKKDIFNIKSLFSKKANNKVKNNIFPKKDNVIITNNFSPIINLKTPVININNNKIISDSREGKKNNKLRKRKIRNLKSNIKIPKEKNKSLIDDTLNVKLKNISLINVDTTGNINKKNNTIFETNYDIIKLSRSDEDLLDMDYEHAIIYDKRKYLRMYWGVLIDNQIILGTFCTENIYIYLLLN